MHWNFVIAGYVIVLGGIGIYSAWLLARGRAMASQVPEERRWFLD